MSRGARTARGAANAALATLVGSLAHTVTTADSDKIDFEAMIDYFDEIGRATVSFPIPAGATADSRFTITTPTGTTSSFVPPGAARPAASA